MPRKKMANPVALSAQKRFVLEPDWDKDLNLKIPLSKSVNKRIESAFFNTLIVQEYNEQAITTEEVVSRLEEILKACREMLKASPYPHHNYCGDPVNIKINDLINIGLKKEFNGNYDNNFSGILFDISVLEEVLPKQIADLNENYKTKKGRPTEEIKDNFIYQVGKVFEEAGGKFTVSNNEDTSGPFWRYLSFLNEKLPTDIRMKNNDLRNRTRKIVKLYRIKQQEKK